jgi:MFS family permease
MIGSHGLLYPLLRFLQISHLDRANIGNAKIEGLEASLGMTGTDYNVALAVFFVPYVLCEVPSNMLLTKFSRPSTYIGILILLWGIVMTLSGVVQNFGGLVATRFFLGLFEAGFFPGAIYLVGQWYPPNRTQFRMSLFYCASAASGAFSGLLAAAIAKMDGLGNYEGWRWIFIIEGLATVLMAFACYFFLPDSPAHAAGKWLTQDEARFLQLTHIYTRGAVKAPKVDEATGKTKFQWSVVWQVLTDWQLYLQALVFRYVLTTTPPFLFIERLLIHCLVSSSSDLRLASRDNVLASNAVTRKMPLRVGIYIVPCTFTLNALLPSRYKFPQI